MAVGTELTTGATRDTNSGDLAGELTALGVQVLSAMALPDDLGRVSDAFREGLAEADLVVSTGGLGPTPDDLTREAIAAACGLEPHVDGELLTWLREMFERRGAPMPDTNRKQAWLLPGASALPNAHGTAPGWWLELPGGRLIIALPGPPREWQPMWRAHALPRLQSGRLGTDRWTHTLRLTGIGELALVEMIGEDVLRATNPQVATYARPDAVDVVVSAFATGDSSAAALGEPMLGRLRQTLEAYVFAENSQGWPQVLAAALGGRTLASVEVGTGGQLLALLGTAPFLVHGQLTTADQPLAELASKTRLEHGTDIGLGVAARQTRDTHVRLVIASAAGVVELRRTAFQAGAEGRHRAALAACAALWEWLRAS